MRDVKRLQVWRHVRTRDLLVLFPLLPVVLVLVLVVGGCRGGCRGGRPSGHGDGCRGDSGFSVICCSVGWLVGWLSVWLFGCQLVLVLASAAVTATRVRVRTQTETANHAHVILCCTQIRGLSESCYDPFNMPRMLSPGPQANSFVQVLCNRPMHPWQCMRLCSWPLGLPLKAPVSLSPFFKGGFV